MKTSVLIYSIANLAFLIYICGCGTVYNTATGKEQKAGRTLSKKVEKKFQPVDNWYLQDRINQIGQKLVEASDSPGTNYYFEVLDDDKINAFALPGGYIYLFKGLMDKLGSDDEIAAVIAHEIGHIGAGHHAKRVRGSLGINALAVLLVASKTDPQTKAQAQRALLELALSYSREDELEADRLAIKYLKGAGFDPKGTLKVLEFLKQSTFDKPVGRYHPYKTHPYISERILSAKKEIFGEIEFEDYINVVEEE